MNISTILLIIGILILLYIVIRYIVSDTSTLSYLASATEMTTISASTLAPSSSGAYSSNFSYSIWVYVNDWNYKYGEPKVIFGRMSAPSSSSSSGTNGSGPCPLVTLGPLSNNLDIALSVYPGITNDTSLTDTTNSLIHTCSVTNVPIQKWVNILISTYGRSLDVYLDGKLVKTCVLPGIAKINDSANVYITPNGGFNGWTSKFQYFPNSTDPQTAWNIYQKGYGSNSLYNLFGNYQVKVSFVENGTESSSITL
jgi:hypothetical protein